MIEVTANVYHWTPDGMRERVASPCARSETAWIEKREVERLLEEAHERGFQRGARAVNAIVSGVSL